MSTAPPFGDFPPSPCLLALQRVLTDRRLSAPVRAALRRRARWLMPRRPVDVTVEGIRFRCAAADNKVDTDIVAKCRLDEAAERTFVGERLAEGGIFVDIGANIGVYTLSALLQGPPGVRVIAIEPHPALRARLAFNLAANGVGDRAEIVPDAVGPDTSRMTLWSNSSRNSGRSSLVRFEGDRAVGIDVTVRPFAAILADHAVSRIDVLKIDVEGYEDQALMPFFDATPEEAWPRAVVIETLHARAWGRDCLAELARLGYRPAGATAENVLLQRGGERK